MRYLTLAEVLHLHDRVLDATGGSAGVRDLGVIESAVAQPKASFEGQDLYPTLTAKARGAVLFADSGAQRVRRTFDVSGHDEVPGGCLRSEGLSHGFHHALRSAGQHAADWRGRTTNSGAWYHLVRTGSPPATPRS